MPRVKRDANHYEISRAFENMGASVFDTAAVGNGYPDINVGYLGHTVLVEIKTETGKLSDRQIEFHEKWGGLCVVIRRQWEVTRLLRLLDEVYYTNTHNLTTKALEQHLTVSGE